MNRILDPPPWRNFFNSTRRNYISANETIELSHRFYRRNGDWVLIRGGAENIGVFLSYARYTISSLIGNFHVEEKSRNWWACVVRAPCARRIAGSSIDLHSPRASCSFQLSIHTLQDIGSFRITIARNVSPPLRKGCNA